MNCSRCGGNMEKGLIKLTNNRYGLNALKPIPLMWYSDKTIEKYDNFFKSIFLKYDYIIYGNQHLSIYSDFIAYHCENCGAILIIPSENDYDRNF